MVVMDERGFGREDYARFHPAGALGRKLMRVSEIMREGDELPLVPCGTSTVDALATMSSTAGRPGAALIVTSERRARRDLYRWRPAPLALDGRNLVAQAADRRVHGPRPEIGKAQRAGRGSRGRPQRDKIDQIAVLDDAHRPVGLLDVQDILDIRI